MQIFRTTHPAFCQKFATSASRPSASLDDVEAKMFVHICADNLGTQSVLALTKS